MSVLWVWLLGAIVRSPALQRLSWSQRGRWGGGGGGGWIRTLGVKYCRPRRPPADALPAHPPTPPSETPRALAHGRGGGGGGGGLA